MTSAKSGLRQRVAIEEKPLVIPRRLALFLGKSAAIFLQQLHYWLGKSKHLIEGVKWIYNSYQAWADQILMLSSSTIKRAVARLKELQLIQVEQHSKSDCNHVNWYTIDYEKLEILQASIGSNCTDRSGQIEQIELLKMTPSSISLDLSERSSESAADSPAAAVETAFEPEQPAAQSPAAVAAPVKVCSQDAPQTGEDRSSAVGAIEFSNELAALGIQENPQVKAQMSKFRDRIGGAIAFVREAFAARKARNPTGLFVTALQQGLSPVQAPSVAPPPMRFDFGAAEYACQIAMSHGDRDFVRAKLQGLIGAGLRPEAERLIDRHGGDWGFVLIDSTVEDF